MLVLFELRLALTDGDAVFLSFGRVVFVADIAIFEVGYHLLVALDLLDGLFVEGVEFADLLAEDDVLAICVWHGLRLPSALRSRRSSS